VAGASVEEDGRSGRLSPFHREIARHSRSTTQKVLPTLSGKHGDHHSFLMEKPKLVLPSVEAAGLDGGMALPAVTPDAARQEQRRKTLHDVMDLRRSSSPIRWPRAMAPRRAAISATARFRRRPIAVPHRYAPPDRFG